MLVKKQCQTFNGLTKPCKVKPLAMAVCCLGGIAVEVQANQIEEVLVTATRRSLSVMDVPYNITALTSEDLKKAQVGSLSDLARQIPGMSYVDLGVRSNGVNMGIIVRGLNGTSAGLNNFSPAAGDTTVTTYINDTPLFTNLKISDVERVEVLRGPQGTLYGAGSVGGTVRFIFNKPNTEAFSADIDTSLGQVADGDDLDYSVDAVFNLPLTDTAALRIAAGHEYYGGVIDATSVMQFDAAGEPVMANPADPLNSPPVFGTKEDIDEADISYVRASLLWNITEDFSALLSVHRQEDHADDYTAQTPLADERESQAFTFSPMDRETDLYSLELEADLGFATLTSTTAFTSYELDSTRDFTNYGLNFQGFYAGYPRIADIFYIDYEEERIIQELRLASNGEGDWDWVAGLYYDKLDQDSIILGDIPGWSEYTNLPGHPTAVAALGPGATYAQYYTTFFYPSGIFSTDITFDLLKNWTNENTALFGELTYHLTDDWQVTGGVRFFKVETSRLAAQNFNPCGPGCTFVATSDDDTEDQIFKINTSYDLNDDTMLYFTWAEGFRQGGQNALPLAGPFAADPALLPYDSDTATNWEVGMKGRLADSYLYTVALFRVDWKDFQTQIPAPFSGIPTIVNGGDARTQGLELELKGQLTDRLSFNFGYAYTEAELTEDFVARSGFNGFDGDQLPAVPEHSLTAAVEYLQPLSWGGADSQISYRLDTNYRSEVTTALNESANNYVELDGFDTWNFSANWSNDRMRFGVFVHNLTDEVGITGVDISNEPSPGVYAPGSKEFILRPRLVGVTFGYSFY